ncbi:MAG: AbrB/MazE/SpoVT family DNA-binding domain-containing protein [Acidimicrobiia bacterium]|nr:AbrB/MazE/SpoVT family DNA-binding domain-containing protein [Acidimicrobiia bacterium]
MDVVAKLTSKGQVTVPKAVREALGLEEGDEVLFRVEGDRAVLGAPLLTSCRWPARSRCPPRNEMSPGTT